MNDTSIGHLGSQPLVYTIAVVHYNLDSYETYVPKLQEQLRKVGYPIKDDVEVTMGDVPGRITQQEKYVQFNDPNSEWGGIVTKNRVVFHTTAYKDSADFIEKFSNFIKVIFETCEIEWINGIAFRQIDNVTLMEGEESLSDAVQSRYLPTYNEEGPNASAYRTEEVQAFKLDEKWSIQLLSRTNVNMSQPSSYIPSDLFLFAQALLTPNIIRDSKSEFVMGDFEAATIANGKAMSYNLDRVIDIIRDLHSHCSRVFHEQFMKLEAIHRRK